LELFGPSLTGPVMIKMTVERPRCPWCHWNRALEPNAVIYQCDLHSAGLFYCSCWVPHTASCRYLYRGRICIPRHRKQATFGSL